MSEWESYPRDNPVIKLKVPDIRFVTYLSNESRELNLFAKWRLATKRREFVLVADWHIFLDLQYLTGGERGELVEYVLPKAKDGVDIVYDGASIPSPWLISFISGGLLRPLGIMFIPSIVHDYFFKFGHILKVNPDGAEATPIERHDADTIFRRMLSRLTGLLMFPWVGWLAVRAGWIFGIKYAGERFGGSPPWAVILILLLLLGGLVYRWFF